MYRGRLRGAPLPFSRAPRRVFRGWLPLPTTSPFASLTRWLKRCAHSPSARKSARLWCSVDCFAKALRLSAIERRRRQIVADFVVLFLAEVCVRLRISVSTAKRLRRRGAFPIPELPSLDKRARFSSRDVDAWLAREGTVRLLRRRA
jgi:hypothetical protein